MSSSASGMTIAVEKYRKDVRHAARRLPRTRRRELLAQIEEHLADIEESSESENEVAARLDRLGRPEDVVAAAVSDSPIQPGARINDLAAMAMLSVGSVVIPVIGWVIGVVLLIRSNSWDRRTKVAAIVVWPFGLGLPFMIAVAGGGGGDSPSSTDLLQLALLLILTIGSVFTVVRLARKRAHPVVRRLSA